ncbi:tetratricopeptide repeat protein [Lysobacter panacisoli]|uniref:Sel1 repeat family protein n=1 Tax=Lysobacter panacisoli TaxID=1255263 RepID=A0ABP9LNL7_9GAMM|nr:hypothetical protein [Lysobacter panacisoli]
MGSSDASVWLGETHLDANDYLEAVRYFTRAASQGDVRGLRGLSLVLSCADCGASKAEIGKAISKASGW